MTACSRGLAFVRRHGLSLALAASGGVLYVATSTKDPCPGESVQYLAQAVGVVPRLTIQAPLWHLLAGMVGRLPWGTVAVRGAFLSALCSAVSLALLCGVLASAVEGLIEATTAEEKVRRAAGRLAGLAAGLFLMGAAPFWSVSNRAHPASFHLLLTLALAALTARFLLGGGTGWAVGAALLWGLGLHELPTLVVFGPLLFGGLLFGFWSRGCLDRRVWLTVIAPACAGALVLPLVAAWRFQFSPGYRIAEYRGYFDVLWITARAQYFLLARSLPREGWLLVLLLTVVPWLTVLSVARRGLNMPSERATLLLHAVLTGVAVAVLLNVRLAPWPLLGWQRLLVTPYLLTASGYGYLAAYWFLLPSMWWPAAEGGLREWVRERLGKVLAGAFVVTALVPFGRNFAACDGRPARAIGQVLEAILSAVPTKTAGSESWLVTDGMLDDALLLLARDRGRSLRTLNLAAAHSETYLHYVEGLFQEPSLRNLARVNLLALLQTWFAADPDIHRRAAVMTLPDLWLAADYRAVPDRTVWLGRREQDPVDVGALWQSHEGFWQTAVPPLRRLARTERHPLAGTAANLLRHLSAVANDWGVLLEDVGEQALARQAYERALEIFPQNVSARLNRAMWIEREGTPDEKAASRRDLQQLAETVRTLPQVWALARFYGYVRSPHLYAQTGWTWALSGQPSLAIAGIRRAMELTPAGQRDRLQEMMAGVYGLMAEGQQSEAIYRDLLSRNPRHPGALLGLARASLLGGRLEEADQWLRKAEEAGAPRVDVAWAWAALNLMGGRADAARVILEDLITLQPHALKPRALLAAVLLEQGDAARLETCLEELRRFPEGYALVEEIRGRQALQRGDALVAWRHYEEAVRAAPRNIGLWEQLVILDLVTGRKEALRRHVATLLALDAGNAMGHYGRGYLQMQAGELDLAEDSLRRSLERRPLFQAHNDLAWVLMRRGAYAEAETHARAALRLNDQAFELWDTLGVILLRLGRYEEAEEALSRALALHPDEVNVGLHMAELYLLRGQHERAAELLGLISARRTEMSSETVEKLGALRRMLEARLSTTPSP